MKSARAYTVVLVTAPDLKTARALAKQALQARLVACANLVPGIESHYWWKGRLEHGREILIVFKTRAARVAALERILLAHHPYDTPEIISVPLAQGTPRYLTWITDSLTR